MNPYTHLRTLIDDPEKHTELETRLYCALKDQDPDEIVQSLFGYRATRLKISQDQRDYYTTNLDALLPLWPEGWRFILDSGIYTNVCRALIYGGQELGSTTQTTPALAMLDCLLQVLEYEWEGKR
jgi:hypothetical protein